MAPAVDPAIALTSHSNAVSPSASRLAGIGVARLVALPGSLRFRLEMPQRAGQPPAPAQSTGPGRPHRAPP
eukprot:scaffold5312_cov118-Isochrysis_galbana.AAC.4